MEEEWRRGYIRPGRVRRESRRSTPASPGRRAWKHRVNDAILTSENNSGTLISDTIILLPTRGKRLIGAMKLLIVAHNKLKTYLFL